MQSSHTPSSDETTLYSLRDHLLIERALGSSHPDQSHQPGQYPEPARGALPYNLPSIHHLTSIPPSRPQYPPPIAPRSEPRFHTSPSNIQQDEGRPSTACPHKEKEENESTIDPATGKKVDKSLSTTKRAQQNRAAQRAFRARKESHIKALEDRLKSLEAVQSSYKQLTTENFELRAYISVLQARLLEAIGSCPPPPPAMNPSTAIDVRISSEVTPGPPSNGTPSRGRGYDQEGSAKACWRSASAVDMSASTLPRESAACRSKPLDDLYSSPYTKQPCSGLSEKRRHETHEGESDMSFDEGLRHESKSAPASDGTDIKMEDQDSAKDETRDAALTTET